jgi:type IV pilus assembly protein PilQ
MKFKQMLAVGLLALFCVGTAMAASQLNSVQVTPSENSATISLRTTGSFAHKEYRPDEHVVLVDLTGVTTSPTVERTGALSSAVIKNYKLSSYTSASGSEVTRIELTLGDGISVEVKDKSDGLQILLTGGGPTAPAARKTFASVANSFPAASTASPVATSKPVVAASATASPAAKPSAANQTLAPKPTMANAAKQSTPETAVPAVKSVAAQQPAQSPTVRPALDHPRQVQSSDTISAATPTIIRSVSVQRGTGTLDVVISGPSTAEPFLLTDPDRLVLDFKNTVVKSTVKNIAVNTKDVLQVRVGRFQAEPPVTRIVIDLSGPRNFEMVPSASQVVIRVKAQQAGIVAAPIKTDSPALASAEPPAAIEKTKPSRSSSLGSAPSAFVSASPKSQTEKVKQPAASLTAVPSSSNPLAASVKAPEAPVKTAVSPSTSSFSHVDQPSIEPKAKADVVAKAEVSRPAANLTATTSPSIPSSPQTAAVKAVEPPLKSAVQPVATSSPRFDQSAPEPKAKTEIVAKVEVSRPAVDSTPMTSAATLSVPQTPLIKAPEPPVTTTAPYAVSNSPSVNQPPAEPKAKADVVAKAEISRPLADSTTTTTASIPSVPESASTKALEPLVKVVAPPTVSSSAHVDQPMLDPRMRADMAAATMAAPRVLPTVEMATAQTTSVSSTPRYTGEPISVNLKDVDLKDFFRLIHEISGLNIVLDPSVRGTVTLVLDDVPWDQALDIVLKNNSLDRELQGNVLRIAGTDTLRREAVDRRAQSEAVALAVDRQTISRFLSYAKAKEVVPTIKKFLTARGDVISDERTNALIISDIPSVLPNLDRLISQLDKKTQEVEIEVRVVSATRSFSRDLGFQLGFNWGNGPSTIGGSNPNQSLLTGTTTGAGSSTALGTNNIPLFSNFPAAGATSGFSISNITRAYGIDAILTAAESHNLAKVLSRPRVVTQSNVKAEVKQGVKLPVATASTGNSIATVSYIDAVLRLSVTPQITSDNTIFLSVDVENTQPNGQSNGNFIMTTQQATTQVLVTDGGTVVIGGVIQTTNSVSTSQTPVLGNIPWLGNLFKERLVKTETDELIFFITPKIIQT